ncbi:glycerol-3-phosphate responsive antiterminator (mRNA-binding) [Desulfosporosinus acidiphilus SJ4]|uniref:Glycerol-3-phosphate responsive antiterminator (MRNA-binding) n=1 Tax=Desulfosporosinus acidiphilus (strain DSM 22704 / JCM 16185 / SJ4) TaxID=646529 RepID=I4DC88_DESAJ|nr:glycerol-3-phosphate responsive antiterminator [Desulfosporosinus acidiphilus]AFM43412.1 glycerol-3-phosphate responsive antiterminator (mRNA-binding) [Desulfosporosinus acidiphilus SJ4]
MDFLNVVMQGKKVGATIRRVEDLSEALLHPNIGAIFLLGGNINILPSVVKKVHADNKVLMVHLDMLEGAGKDKAGIHLLARMGLRGLVTTKPNLVKFAKEEGMVVIQRLFVLDSESVKTGIKMAAAVKPNAVEILPATIPHYVIQEMKDALGIPVLGGGLLRTEEDVRTALAKGIDAVSTSLQHLWDINFDE